VDGSWWSFDDTRVTKLSSPSEIKTASAYILFYTKRSSFAASSHPFPFNPQHQQHWCKSLIKKYHKVPSLTNSISTINGESLTEKETPTNNASTTTSDQKQDSTNDESTSKDSQGSAGSQTLNGYHNSVSSSGNANATKLSNSNSAAPLARMEDIGVNYNVNELQIESTV